MKDNKELFEDLMRLCASNEAFFFKDHNNLDAVYRIFDYRLASYTDFCSLSALFCRGIMFEVSSTGEYIKLASLPMNKFFNYGENPFTMFDKNTPSTEIVMAVDKLDGSLISSFMNTDLQVQFKSKGSLTSDHAVLANQLVNENNTLQNELYILESFGFTSNFELLSPELRIVVPYQKDEIRFLNARNRVTGEYLQLSTLKEKYPELYSTSVYQDGYIASTVPMKETLLETVEAVREMPESMEGYVFQLKNGTFFKVKTDKYCALHHTKDSINVDSRLYDAVLEGATDDLRQLFATDEYCINKIKKMEQLVFVCYNSIVSDVTNFYETNKHLGRKEYALKCKSDLDSDLNRQGLAFILYSGRTPDYKLNMQKYSKEVLAKF